MITPQYLCKGDRIAIIAPARKISPAEIETSVQILESWGLQVMLGKNLFKENHQYAGTDEERAADFQQMLDDDSIKAIICARGGYGTVRIIDKLDFSRFAANPKWIAGYSDITVLHSHIQTNMEIETLHSTMPLQLNEEDIPEQTHESLRRALFGEQICYEQVITPLSRKGTARGILTGGNLSVLYSISATPSDIETDGRILFLEDLDEYLYHVDRMMMNLKRSGKLEGLAGLIVGSFSKIHDNAVPFGKDAQEIIAETVSGYDYPVCFDFPAGHEKKNVALIMGREVDLTVDDQMKIVFSLFSIP